MGGNEDYGAYVSLSSNHINYFWNNTLANSLTGDGNGYYNFSATGNYTLISKIQSGELEDTEEINLEVI